MINAIPSQKSSKCWVIQRVAKAYIHGYGNGMPPPKRKPNEEESTTHRIIPSIHHLRQSLIFFVVALSKGKTYN